MKNAILIILLSISINAHASGQRSEQITSESLQRYPRITLGDAPAEVLRYMGTASLEDGRVHLLMITRTSVSRRADGSPGMPWDSVFGYLIDADELEIVNGWSLDEQLGGEGVHLRPSYCPRVPISDKVRRFELPADEWVKRGCLEMRQPRR